MAQRTVVLELAGEHKLARDLVAGGVFVPGEKLKLNEDCSLVLRGANEQMIVHATCVWVDGNGSGLQLVGCDATMKEQIAALAQSVSETMSVAEPPAHGSHDALPVQAPADEVGLAAARVETDERIAEAELRAALDQETLRDELVPLHVQAHDAPADDAPAQFELSDLDSQPPEPHHAAASDAAADTAAHEAEHDGAANATADEAEHDGAADAIGDEAADATDDDGADAAGDNAAGDDLRDEERKIALNVHERLRGLTLVQQLKLAQHGEVSERIILERMYGKNVWEALLRNPRLTGPEVARIARMGSLPRPLVEIIVGNGGWLQIPEVRRALLTNPRLGTDQILRVLRLLPKHELKLAAVQTAYPFAVRSAAKQMLKETV